MSSSIFSIEVAVRMDAAPGLLDTLRACIQLQPEKPTMQQKWEMYQQAANALVNNIGLIERGCWDYFEDEDKAEKDFKMWLGGMTTEEGARQGPSGRPAAYRGSDPRYLTFTMTFLLMKPSPTDDAIRQLCDIPQNSLWYRNVFSRILTGMGIINFASVKSDVMYLLPRDEDWGLTADDLAEAKFEYLRPVVD